jgi:hypothetical protein
VHDTVNESMHQACEHIPRDITAARWGQSRVWSYGTTRWVIRGDCPGTASYTRERHRRRASVPRRVLVLELQLGFRHALLQQEVIPTTSLEDSVSGIGEKLASSELARA